MPFVKNGVIIKRTTRRPGPLRSEGEKRSRSGKYLSRVDKVELIDRINGVRIDVIIRVVSGGVVQ